jgi:hypothetical protein
MGDLREWFRDPPDARIVAHLDDPLMLEPEPVELEAHLQVSDDHLSGEIRLPDGRTLAFDGWLGLIGAVEAALGPRPSSTADP